jgi:hypothetical protein
VNSRDRRDINNAPPKKQGNSSIDLEALANLKQFRLGGIMPRNLKSIGVRHART